MGKLQIDLYNGMFINCVDNNLLGVLMSYNEDLMKLAVVPNMTYALVVPADDCDSHPEGLFTCGDLTLFVHSEAIEYSNWFEYIDVSPEIHRTPTIHHLIQRLIDEHFYVFIEVNRFYLPRGVEFRLRDRIHPTFIYGYDATNKVYYMVEDCIHLGKFEYYELSYELMEESFRSVYQYKSPECYGYRIKNKEACFDGVKISKNMVIDSLNFLRQTRFEKNPADHYYAPYVHKYYGIECLKLYSKKAGGLFMQLEERFIHQYIPIKRPLEIQYKMMTMLQHLYESNQIKEEKYRELMEKYKQIRFNWDFYKNKMYNFIRKKAMNYNCVIPEGFFTGVEEAVQKNYDLETEVSKSFLLALE